MNCSEVEHALTEDISAASLREIRRHLERCPRCARLSRELNSMEELSELLRRRVQAPRDFSSRVTDAVSRLEERRRPTLLLALAACLVVLAVGWFEAGRQGPAPELAREVKPVTNLRERWVESGPAAGPGYVEVMLPGSSEEEVIIQIPARIVVHREGPNPDFYLRKVSH